TVFGDGSQTRSFCYVADEIRGLISLAESGYHNPVNIGNPNEFTLLELAEAVIEITGSKSEIVFEALPTDDPQVRRPDITPDPDHQGNGAGTPSGSVVGRPARDVRRKRPPVFSFLLRFETVRKVARVASLLVLDYIGVAGGLLTALVIKTGLNGKVDIAAAW